MNKTIDSEIIKIEFLESIRRDALNYYEKYYNPSMMKDFIYKIRENTNECWIDYL